MNEVINHPGRIIDFHLRLESQKAKAENAALHAEVERLQGIVAAIFDGIARGEKPELKYDDGSTIVIARYRAREKNEGGD